MTHQNASFTTIVKREENRTINNMRIIRSVLDVFNDKLKVHSVNLNDAWPSIKLHEMNYMKFIEVLDLLESKSCVYDFAYSFMGGDKLYLFLDCRVRNNVFQLQAQITDPSYALEQLTGGESYIEEKIVEGTATIQKSIACRK